MKNLLFLFLFFFSLSMTSCISCGDKTPAEGPSSSVSDNDGDDSSESNSPGNKAEPENLADAMKEAKDAMKQIGMNTDVKTVNFRELQKMMPEKLDGMERISKSGETAGAMGMTFSTAEAKYKDDGGTVYEIKIVDTGGLGMGLMSMAAWSMATIDKEDDNGYERTSTLDGQKSFEKFRKRNEHCELSVIAHDRYIITGECQKCKMDRLKKIFKKMGIEDMKDLKAEG
ncbi:MAG TPA: hypothetical protein ENJ95_08185 [Bacteroidetes bacterium]|nr:hypothetical protein [Bacteroidota bacterium]